MMSDKWKSLPMPSQRKEIPYTESFTPQEAARIRKGFIPRAMEDKWFIHSQDDRVFFHRSWTGYCIFEIGLTLNGETFIVTEAWANRNAEQYRATSDEDDAKLLASLIHNKLLPESRR